MSLPRRALPLVSVAALALGACGDDSPSSTTAAATAVQTSTTTQSTSSSAGSGGANTAAVVKAADAFLATLSDEQKSTVIVGDFGDQAVKTSWSNLPAALSPRKGIALGDMNAAQRKAALALMDVVLSDQGSTELADVRRADDYLAAAQSSGGGGGGPGGGDDYGAGNYYFAFYGQPSATKQWLLQYTGHHLTYNTSYKGDQVTFGPAFEGVEPISFKDGSKTIAPLTDEAAGFKGVLDALSDTQKSSAQLSQAYDDLLLGAGKDGPFPDTPEGVKVGDLSQAGQDAVTRTIEAYVGDLDDAAAKKLVQSYVNDYDKTSFAFSGGTDTEAQGFYARIDGPKAWIEISTQHGIVLSGTHYHSIYREQGSDYGGS